ncbi:hypothetical protein [Bacillus wiedmannii]|uniref:hypothetical protein n=1 Tax=Bacillus wiedmannii TaxID=1890302 RepID=UPI003D225549
MSKQGRGEKNMKRIYAEELHTSTSEDAVNLTIWLRKKQQELSEEEGLALQKKVYNDFREVLGTTKVIAVLMHDNGKEIGIFVFDVEATADNAFQLLDDEERHEYYLEVE